MCRVLLVMWCRLCLVCFSGVFVGVLLYACLNVMLRVSLFVSLRLAGHVRVPPVEEVEEHEVLHLGGNEATDTT